MAIIGVIETELRASSRHESGGLGPLFKKTTVVAPFEAGEFLSRTLRAFERLGGMSVVNLFIDDEDLLTEEHGDEVTIAQAREVLDASFARDGREFTVMFAHRDRTHEYTISAEGSTEHELGDPTFVVLATLGLPVTDEDAGDLDQIELAEDEDADEGEDGLALVEALLRRLLGELDKELALADPDLRVWDEDVGNPASPPRGIEWAG